MSNYVCCIIIPSQPEGVADIISHSDNLQI